MSRLHRRRAITARQKSSLFEALEYYRETKKRVEEWNKKHYSGKRFAKRKKPWYMITTGKQYNYEEHTMSFGQCMDYFRVASEAKKYHVLHCLPKITKDQYKERLISAKLADWERKNPMPANHEPAQIDMFEEEFTNNWLKERAKAHENIQTFVQNIGTKVTVFARYVGDTGYPHKVVEFRSDRRPLTIMDGKYTNYLFSKTIQRAQKLANMLDNTTSGFIAVKVIDGDQCCILLPYRGLPT